jgi:uncharacterized membrane protein
MSTTATQLSPAPPEWEGVGLVKRTMWRAEGFVRRHRDFFIVLGLIALAAALRMMMSRGLWLDEATSVAQAKMDFGRMLSYMRESDVHPPLHQIILWADIRLFGDSEFAVRLPSLVFGTALVPVLYGLGRDMFGRTTGLIAALIGAIGPAAVWYSQEARMYPLFMLLATLTIWAQLRAVRSGSWKAWLAYSIVTSALMWTHYFSALHVMVQQLAFFALMWTKRGTPSLKPLFKGWLRSTLLIILLTAPVLVIPYAQFDNYGNRDTVTLQANGAVEAGAPIYTAISNVASAMLGYHSAETMTQINALWPLGMLAALLALGRGRSRSTMLLAGLVVIPMAVLFVVGLERRDVFELRYFAQAVPALALLIARAITLAARRKRTIAAGVIAVCVVLGLALYAEQTADDNQRVYDFRSALTELNAQQQPGDLLLYEPFYLHPTVHYYAPDFTSYPLVTGLESTTEPERIIIVGSLEFAEREQSAERVQLVVDRLTQDRELVQNTEKNNIEVWVFQ